MQYKYGLLGENVDYSRSPEIFDRIFEVEGLDGEFSTLNCSTDELPDKLRRLIESGYTGLCVTIPHKEAIFSLVENVDTVARTLRSVNSVKIESGRAYGFNTDAYGFTQPLLPYMSELKGGSAVILGSGGAARSSAFALGVDFEIRHLTLIGRNKHRLEQTQTMLNSVLPQTEILTHEWPNDAPISALLKTANLFVNATPLCGPNVRMSDAKKYFKNTPESLIYYDLNYNTDNEALAEFQSKGNRTINGLPMLAHQALRSFHLWTGRKTDFDAVFEALK